MNSVSSSPAAINKLAPDLPRSTSKNDSADISRDIQPLFHSSSDPRPSNESRTRSPNPQVALLSSEPEIPPRVCNAAKEHILKLLTLKMKNPMTFHLYHSTNPYYYYKNSSIQKKNNQIDRMKRMLDDNFEKNSCISSADHIKNISQIFNNKSLIKHALKSDSSTKILCEILMSKRYSFIFAKYKKIALDTFNNFSDFKENITENKFDQYYVSKDMKFLMFIWMKTLFCLKNGLIGLNDFQYLDGFIFRFKSLTPIEQERLINSNYEYIQS